MSTEETEVEIKTISEFRPYLNRFKCIFKVIEKEDTVEVQNRNSDESHQMSNVTIADESASVILTAWDDDIEYLAVGSYFSLTNGYVNLYRDSMRLARGKYGEFSESDADFEPNTEINKSDEQHERRPRRGGGGGGRSSSYSSNNKPRDYSY